MYRMSRAEAPFLVHLAGRPGYLWNPEARVQEGFEGWKYEITFTDSLESREDDRDFFLLCAAGKAGTTVVPQIFCAWADNGGYMIGVLTMSTSRPLWSASRKFAMR